MDNKRQNWGKYSTWYPEKIVSPSSLEQLLKEIAAARASGLKMRLAGSLHSMNSLPATSEIQIQTDKLSRVLKIDRERQRVTVEGGIKIRELLDVLHREGLTLPNQGYITDQSIAGAIATATHGSGSTGTLSSFVEEIELLDGTGTLHRLSPQIDKHLFSAAVVNLGCLGVVYSLTLRCIPAQKLRLTRARGRLAPTLQQLPELLKSTPYFQLMLDPYSDALLSWRFQTTADAYKNRWQYRARRMLIKTLAVASFDFLPSPSWSVPQLFKILSAVSPIECVDDGYKLLSPADEGHYIEQEIAVPLEHFESALKASRAIIDLHTSRNMCRVLLQLIRFAQADDYGYLSPALNRPTAYISQISIAKEGIMELFQDIERALYQFEGRPHWGKVHFLTKERVIQLYGNNYTLFREARQQLDSDGLFSNEHVAGLGFTDSCR